MDKPDFEKIYNFEYSDAFKYTGYKNGFLDGSNMVWDRIVSDLKSKLEAANKEKEDLRSKVTFWKDQRDSAHNDFLQLVETMSNLKS